jgi:hypothetical protein
MWVTKLHFRWSTFDKAKVKNHCPNQPTEKKNAVKTIHFINLSFLGRIKNYNLFTNAKNM